MQRTLLLCWQTLSLTPLPPRPWPTCVSTLSPHLSLGDPVPHVTPKKTLWAELGPSCLPGSNHCEKRPPRPTLAESNTSEGHWRQARPGHTPGPLAASRNHRQLLSPACFGDLDKCLSYSTKKKKKNLMENMPQMFNYIWCKKSCPYMSTSYSDFSLFFLPKLSNALLLGTSQLPSRNRQCHGQSRKNISPALVSCSPL